MLARNGCRAGAAVEGCGAREEHHRPRLRAISAQEARKSCPIWDQLASASQPRSCWPFSHGSPCERRQPNLLKRWFDEAQAFHAVARADPRRRPGGDLLTDLPAICGASAKRQPACHLSFGRPRLRRSAKGSRRVRGDDQSIGARVDQQWGILGFPPICQERSAASGPPRTLAAHLRLTSGSRSTGPPVAPTRAQGKQSRGLPAERARGSDLPTAGGRDCRLHREPV